MADDIYSQLDQLDKINNTAQAVGIRPELLHAVIRQESAGQSGAVSPKGAIGLMQVMPQTAAQPGLGVQPFDPHDPDANLKGGAQYLKALLDKFHGNEAQALAAYNAGLGAVQNGTAAHFPETQHYVQNITAHAGPQNGGGDIFSQLDSLPAPNAPQTSVRQDGFIGRAINSAGNAFDNVLHTLSDPAKAGADALGLTVGLAQKGLPASATQTLVNATGNPNLDKRAQAEAFARFQKQRYGGWQNIKNTANNDPVGMAMDISSLLGLGGGAGEALTGAGLIDEAGIPARIAEAAGTAAPWFDPVQLPGRIAANTVQPVARQFAEHVANVSLQIPKAMRKRELGSPFTPAEAVLNENRGFLSNPATRFSQGGLTKAEAREPVLRANYENTLAADAPNTYSLDPIKQILEDQKAKLGHDINAQPKQAQVQAIIDNLQNNPLYSKDRLSQVMVPQTVQVPHPWAVDASGLPIMQTQTTMVPQTQVVGRDLIPQPATELNTIKGNVDKGLTFGERGGTLDEAQKAARHGIDQIIDTNVPGADALNQRRAQNTVATKALQNAILAHQTKRGIGLMEQILAFGAPIAAVEHQPAMAAAMMVPSIYNTIVKHPTTASLAAVPTWALGNYTMSPFARTALGAVTPVTQATQAPNARPIVRNDVTKDEIAAVRARQQQ